MEYHGCDLCGEVNELVFLHTDYSPTKVCRGCFLTSDVENSFEDFPLVQTLPDILVAVVAEAFSEIQGAPSMTELLDMARAVLVDVPPPVDVLLETRLLVSKGDAFVKAFCHTVHATQDSYWKLVERRYPALNDYLNQAYSI